MEMVRHLAGIAEIVEDLEAAIGFYRDRLGLEVRPMPGGGYAEVEIGGVAHFGVWLRSHAAEMVLGDPEQAHRIPLGFTVGFEVDGVEAAEKALRAGGADVVQADKLEPWGQRTARLLGPSGALLEVSETPQARRLLRDVETEAG
jgi:catechol 2,3-dioxygenase-like lactoylglutathione lyase family enzyme